MLLQRRFRNIQRLSCLIFELPSFINLRNKRALLIHRRHKMSAISEVGKVHQIAQEGFTQGSHYDQNRPSYADELVSHVADILHHGNHNDIQYDILELGAGTGKFTRKMLDALMDQDKLKYLATEPSESFLDVLRKKSPDLNTLVCTATSIPLPDCSVKNIICAQSFHWFATKESLQEISRVLVPKGRLFLVWNDKDWDIEWLRKMEDVLTLYYDVETPRKITGKWKNVFDGSDLFRCVEHTYLPGVNMKGSKDFMLEHFTSISVIARLDEEEKQRARQQFLAVLDETFPTDDDIIIPFKSDLYCAEKC